MKDNLKKGICLLVLLTTIFTESFSQNIIKSGRDQSFDADWKFQKGKSLDAKNNHFDDKNWRKLDVPHDWSIEDLADNSTDSIIGPFYKNAIGKNATAFTVGGTAWYRKQFTLDQSTSGKKVLIQFDGVYMNSDVWINGHHLGNHVYGYTAFIYDLTPYLNPIGKDNLIAVEVKNEGENSRWYSGSGIYRHVWMHVLNSTHIENWGVQIVSNDISEQSAEIHIATKIENPIDNISIKTQLYSADNKLVGTSITKLSNQNKVEQMILLKYPKLWDIENPNLYNAKITLEQNGKILDTYTQTFGVRSIKFSSENGFTLNSKSVKLKGGCIHHDNGPLGAAAIDRAEVRKIELLKNNGYNAVRLAHNPYSQELLDACDKLGVLVINEAFDMWNTSKTTNDYSNYFKDNWQKDLSTIVQKDFNHPSIIMLSIGNEITEIVDSLGYEYSKKLTDFVKTMDTTRAVTGAMPFHIPLMKRKKWDTTAPSFAPWDVAGYNYAMNTYENDHKKFPKRIMMATEYFPPKALENWDAVEKNSYVIGMFSWAAIDYLGEAGIGLARLKDNTKKQGGGMIGGDFMETFMSPQWPIFNPYTGELDMIGNKKSASYYLDVVWRRSKIEMLVHRPIPADFKEVTGFYAFPDEMKSWTWTGHENDSLQVRVFTRAEKVKLELNGKTIAEQLVPKESITTVFKVPYIPGKLVARSFIGEKEIASETLETAGKPVAIRLKADRNYINAGKNDLAFVQVEIVDAAGNVVPNLDDKLIKYQITGNGSLAGLGNGNTKDMSSFQKPEKKVFQGKGLVIIRPNVKAGKIILKAEAQGLKSEFLTIIAN